MRLYGFKKTTLIDYPGKIACTVFTHGCTLRCPYCHNPELVTAKPEESKSLETDELLTFLDTRKGKLEGVVFTGGEPLLWLKELKPLFKEIHSRGFLIKVDTNGTLPSRLSEIIHHGLADYVAMDFKVSPNSYKIMKSNARKTANVLTSLSLLKKSSIPYEIRTTLVPGIHTEEVLADMMPYIKDVPKYVLQNFEPNGTVDPSFAKVKSFSREHMRRFLRIAKSFNKKATVRIPD